mmetsp:Transcript_18459/g.42112  ORF Transcript_18459/g.42112 Transcript_18459/m.42112 type:complete len:173 (-) Transcript_18459:277-795(-)
MIAVGVGIAPMVQALEKILETPGDKTEVVLLYGNRSIRDILLREKLDEWSRVHGHRFKVVYAVGSRWANVHFGMKKAAKQGFSTSIDDLKQPPVAKGFESLEVSASQAKELGWVDESAIRRHGFSPSDETRVFVCGLPGVYDKLCGPRTERGLPADSALARLGFQEGGVVKF